MKKNIEFKEALEISEMLFGVLRATKPEDMQLYEIKSLFMLREAKTNNLKEIKELVWKRFYHVPKQILEVRIAKTLKKLMDKGLVTKTKCPEDKRQALLEITPAGTKLLEETDAAAEKKWKEVTNG